MIETHAHLHFPQLLPQIDQVLARATAAGVTTIVNVASDIAGAQASIRLAKRYPQIYATVGVHPHDVAAYDRPTIIELLNEPKVVAIGEIGLDYFKSQTAPELQKKVFADQVEIALSKKLPVIVHNRDADTDVLEILDYYKVPQAVFHCYSSSVEYLKKILDRGWLVSFTGNITFPKNDRRMEILTTVPLGSFMLETDCPFMAPVPHRGKTNEPSYLPFVAQEIARIKNISVEVVEEATTNNAKRFFNIR
jgi:TatD DNase family protein